MTSPLLLLEPIGGLSGDMFLGAALDLGVEREALEARLATLGLPGWRLAVGRVEVSGIAATRVEVVVEGEPPPRRLPAILALIDGSDLSPRAKAAARALFERLGRAEAKVHGVGLEQVHFHEVGAVDSIVDLCGAAVALDLLGWPRARALPPELGRGLVKTAHGPMPVPPPAVVELLLGKPVRPGGPPGEAVTPTGAALLAELFELGPLPPHVPRRAGYGAGTARWPDRPNVVRMILADPAPAATVTAGPAPAGTPGSAAVPAGGLGSAEPLVLLEANLDDCSPQVVAYAVERALAAGALDAWATPVTMKKGRPGLVLSALCAAATREPVARLLLTETTTLGVRFREVSRWALERELVEVATIHGPVRVKVARLDGREVQAQPEFEDCAAIARATGVPLREVQAAAVGAWRSKTHPTSR